jgi:hypothetical protein
VSDRVFQYRVARKPQGVQETLRLQVLVDLRIRKRSVSTKELRNCFTTIALHDRLKHRTPVVGAVHVPVTKRDPLQIAMLVEQKQRVIAGALEVAVAGVPFVIAVCRADRGISVR